MEELKVDAESINAITDALGALVFATVRRLPAEQQQAFAGDLARFAKLAERDGRLVSETLLLDMYRAAQTAR